MSVECGPGKEEGEGDEAPNSNKRGLTLEVVHSSKLGVPKPLDPVIMRRPRIRTEVQLTLLLLKNSWMSLSCVSYARLPRKTVYGGDVGSCVRSMSSGPRDVAKAPGRHRGINQH